MSIVGTVSPPKRCACGSEYASNVLHIGNANFAVTHDPTVASTNGMHGSVYVCDLCLWDALDTFFGGDVHRAEYRPVLAREESA